VGPAPRGHTCVEGTSSLKSTLTHTGHISAVCCGTRSQRLRPGRNPRQLLKCGCLLHALQALPRELRAREDGRALLSKGAQSLQAVLRRQHLQDRLLLLQSAGSAWRATAGQTGKTSLLTTCTPSHTLALLVLAWCTSRPGPTASP